MSTLSDLPQEEPPSSPAAATASAASASTDSNSQDNAHDNDPTDPSPSDHDTSPTLITVRQLFVGNLPFRVRWQDLKDLFRKAGNVLRADVALTYDKRSKGHGTVLFATVQDAQNAVDMLHNYRWHGRALEVREDRGYLESKQGQSKQKHASPSKSTPPFDTHGGTPQNAIGRQLFVGNLPFHCQWQDLKDLFRMAGNIQRADIAHGPDGRSRGFGTVLYATPEDANKAIDMFDGNTFKGRQLRVHLDKFVAGPPATGEDILSAGDTPLQPSPSAKHPFDTAAFRPYPMNYPLPSPYTTMHPQQSHQALFMPDTSLYKPQPFHFMPNFGGLPPPPVPYDLFPPAPSSLGDPAIYDPASAVTTSGQAAAAAAHHAAAAASAYPTGLFMPPPPPPPSAAGLHPHPLFTPPPPPPYPWSPHESYPFDPEAEAHAPVSGESTAVPAPSTFMSSPSPPASAENDTSKSEGDVPPLTDAFSAMKLKEVPTTSLMHELPSSSTHLMGSNPVWEPLTGLNYKK